MTYKEAADILDPETRIEALVEIGYYNGFNSDKAQSDAVNEACRIAAEVLRGAADTNAGNKWESAKDNPPKESGEYIVGCNRPGERMVDTSFWFANKKEWALFDEEVTHWMPLPEPPEMD